MMVSVIVILTNAMWRWMLVLRGKIAPVPDTAPSVVR
jgi:hypothetical protein